jgi:vancomycin resistance protein YoaR
MITKPPLLIVGASGILCCIVVGYIWHFADRITPNTWVGSVEVGSLTRQEAAGRLQATIDELDHAGLALVIGDASHRMQATAIGLQLQLSEALEQAFTRGHRGGVLHRIGERVTALWRDRRLHAPAAIDAAALEHQVDEIADAHERDRRDIRLQVEGTTVTLLTDTEPGKVIDRTKAVARIGEAVMALDTREIVLEFEDDPPHTDPTTAPDAVAAAEKMMAKALVLSYEDHQYTISRERIGGWIVSEYEENHLRAGVDRELIADYITGIAELVNKAPKPPVITTQNGRVTDFTPPEVGRAVQEDVLVQIIIDTVMKRARGIPGPTVLLIPTKATKLPPTGLGPESGITELIGKATTTFTGSPKNRILNIKNGVKFLTGALVEAGQEFSTLSTLGKIDNSSGYLPELVIKGDRTTPEWGGGLCQVSTTLFRAVMDAGLPITARRNHSFRVSYYEKDGNGKPIGPGLDATIYEPNTDFRFLNDTGYPILIIGYVIGDKISFEFYGTSDGRTSIIGGPKILSEIPPGDPEYIETLDLAPGVTKQVENPHPGGSTLATYSIMYPDGRTHYQEFTSWYRRWPAKYLIGVTQLSSPSPSPSATPFPVSPSQE